jgi:N-acetylmuramic acid 6-phosphate etherase
VDTEQPSSASSDLHALDVAACVDLMNQSNREVLLAVERGREALVGFVRALEGRFGPCEESIGSGLVRGRLIYVGAGTSGRLGVLDASEAPPTFCVPPGLIVGLIAGGDTSLRRSSEGREDEPDGARAELESLGLTHRDSVLAIAAGGTTPYALGALKLAKELAPGCVTGLLTCARVGSVPHCDHLIVMVTGAEILTGSTRLKAGTATKIALNTISTALMVRAGRVYGNLMVDVRATNSKLRDRAARVVSSVTGLGRAEALAALDRAGGHAKTAIVMAKLGIDEASAQAKLADVHGRLDRLIGPPQQ